MTHQSIILGMPISIDLSSSDDGNVSSSKHSKSKVKEGIPPASGKKLITYTGDNHLMTVGPTGAGKGRSVIIPNLLQYSGPVIVVDPKGENYAVTARRRREMGQQVVKLDPFHISPNEPYDSFNPFDIVKFSQGLINDEIKIITELLMVDKGLAREPFWDNWANTVITGFALHLATTNAPNLDKSIIGIFDALFNDDPIYKTAVLLDQLGTKMDNEARQLLASFLSITADPTRSGILASAQQYMSLFGSQVVRDAVSNTSFNLGDIFEGNPLTLYIIIPPSKLSSHKALLRLWVGALLSLISNRRTIPLQNTLFIIDEAAQLGTLSMLRTAKTLLRGYGLQTWSFWQDFSQIRLLYEDWETIVNNCAILQVFNARNHLMAREFASIVGVDVEEVREISRRDEQMVVINGDNPIRMRKIDYLEDTEFYNQYDNNPYYSNRA